MTPAPIKPGDHINGVEVLSIDPVGKRAVVACPCGSTHLVSVEALAAGQVACPAARPTKQVHPRPATGNTKEKVK